MNGKMLKLTDQGRDGRRFCFNPLMIACITEHFSAKGKICVEMIAAQEECFFEIEYDYNEAIKLWEKALTA